MREATPINRFERHGSKVLAVLLLAFVIMALAVVEWILTPRGGRHAARALSDSPAPARHLVMREWKPDTDYVYAPPPERGLFKDAGYSRAYKLSTDRDGFIQPSVRHAKPDAEIVFLGGSTTKCMFVTPGKRFPHLAAERLEQALGLKINGINAGRSGNTTMHAHALLIAKVLPRRPDVVVLMEAVNDMGLLRRGGYWPSGGGQRMVDVERVSVGEGLETVVRALLPNTFAAILQAKRVLLRKKPTEAAALEAVLPGKQAIVGDPATAVRTTPLPSAWLQPARDYEASLRMFVRTVQAWGGTAVLMTQVRVPTSSEAERRASFLRRESLGGASLGADDVDALHDHFNDIVRRVAAEEKAILIDLVRGHAWRFGDVYDQIHFTDQGSEKVAELVAAAIQPVLAGLPRRARPEGGRP